jgi:type IV secretion system protein VirD4
LVAPCAPKGLRVNAFEALLALGTWGKTHPQLMIGGIGAVPILMAGVKLVTGRGRGRDDTHGSARFATPREMRRAGLYAAHGVMCGKITTGVRTRFLCDDSDTHILLLGPTRSKKGRAHILPTLRQTWRHSVLVLDPKDGENYDRSADYRAAYGDVYAFSPYRSSLTCLNVADAVRWGTPHEFQDCLLIGRSLTAPDKMARESDTGRHFRDMASFLLTGALLHVHYRTGFCSLAAVYHFLSQQSDTLADALNAMSTAAHTVQGVHQAIATITRAIGNASGRSESSGIWSTAIRPLVLYNDPYVARSTDSSTVTFDALQYGPRPVSLYLLAPSPRSLKTLHPVYRVILDVALERLTDHKPDTYTHRLLIVADELADYGYCEALDKGPADMAGYGQKAFFIVQDLDQFFETYGEKNSIWGNTHLKLFHTPANDLTAKRLSENMTGRGTVVNPVHQHEGGIAGRRSVSVQHVARALLTPDEFMELDPTQVLGRMSGIKPFLITKVDYEHDFKE